jgi:hypothetical protein
MNLSIKLNLHKNYEIMYFLLDLAAFSNFVLSFIK